MALAEFPKATIKGKSDAMDEKKILTFLHYPASALVDLDISMANLTWQEETAINLCGRKNMTQEKAAEKTGYSSDSMHRWYRQGIEKLSFAWDGFPWIEKLIQ